MSQRIMIEKWFRNTSSQIVEAQIPEKYNILILSGATVSYENLPKEKIYSFIITTTKNCNQLQIICELFDTTLIYSLFK